MSAPVTGSRSPLPGQRPPLDEELLKEAPHFEFFQAVRLLERIHPARESVGLQDVEPADEVVHFGSNPSLVFPASAIQAITGPGERPYARMLVNYIFDKRRRERVESGLTGVLGVLPWHYSQLLVDRTREKQTRALREFLDLFTHRLISLFYRAWEKYRFPIAYERHELRRRPSVGREAGAPPPTDVAAAEAAEATPWRGSPRFEEDPFSQNLFCLIGLGTKGLRERLTIDDHILLHYAGLLAQRPRSAVSLEGMLQDYFGVAITVVQFQGQWFEMNADLLTTLGEQGQNHQLGVSAVLWDRIWDPPARFRIQVGPLDLRQFQDFMPGAPAYTRLLELTRFYVGDDLNFEVEPRLKRDEVPYCRLGGSAAGSAVAADGADGAAAGEGAAHNRLGWSMWLKTGELEQDVPQPVFEARVAAA